MSRREGRVVEVRDEYTVPPSKCAKVLYYTWKLCSVVFSHFVMISLVVAYCILGAVTFEKLEAQHEREVKQNISQIRRNTTSSILLMTNDVLLLDQTNWTTEVVDILKDFENALLLEMKVRGWDGSENLAQVQWTFTGALFYSIIVITTIGYGHIVPKTQSGKVVTIFYAILGIPLMLLCLSNIGDVMASSFRFLYWRMCCYMCTRPPKRRRRHHSAGPASRRSLRGRPASVRKRPRPLERAHSDTDFRYRDSGYSSARHSRPRAPRTPRTLRADTTPRAILSPRAARAPRGAPYQPPPRTRSQPPVAMPGIREFDLEDKLPPHLGRYAPDDAVSVDEEDFPKISLPLRDLEAALKDLETHQKKVTSKSADSRSKSLPRHSKSQPEHGPRRDWDSDVRNYELDAGPHEKEFIRMHDLHDVDYENYKEKKAIEERERRRKERDDYNYLRDVDYDPEDEDFEFDNVNYKKPWDNRRLDRGCSEYYDDRERYEKRQGRRARSEMYEYDRPDRPDRRDRDEFRRRNENEERPKRLRRLQTVDDSRYYSPSPDEDWSDEEAPMPKLYRQPVWNSRQQEICSVPLDSGVKEEMKPVPIWLCVLLVASYIVVGTFLFKRWEGWSYLDAAYFCFITLTTIGFGDFVPAQGQGGEPAAAVHSIALCSLYLLFGIALLAMSFNLVQEEVRANVAALAMRLGIIKPQRTEDNIDSDDG